MTTCFHWWSITTNLIRLQGTIWVVGDSHSFALVPCITTTAEAVGMPVTWRMVRIDPSSRALTMAVLNSRCRELVFSRQIPSTWCSIHWTSSNLDTRFTTIAGQHIMRAVLRSLFVLQANGNATILRWHPFYPQPYSQVWYGLVQVAECVGSEGEPWRYCRICWMFLLHAMVSGSKCTTSGFEAWSTRPASFLFCFYWGLSHFEELIQRLVAFVQTRSAAQIAYLW